jgi:hypothetical protein
MPGPMIPVGVVAEYPPDGRGTARTFPSRLVPETQPRAGPAARRRDTPVTRVRRYSNPDRGVFGPDRGVGRDNFFPVLDGGGGLRRGPLPGNRDGARLPPGALL